MDTFIGKEMEWLKVQRVMAGKMQIYFHLNSVF